MCIETLDELLTSHAEVSTQGRHTQTDIERLVIKLYIGSIACYRRPRYFRPRFHEALLQKRRLQPLYAQVT